MEHPNGYNMTTTKVETLAPSERMNVKQVAAFLNIGRHTVYRWAKMNPPMIPYVPYGRKKIFIKSVIEAWEAKRMLDAKI